MHEELAHHLDEVLAQLRQEKLLLDQVITNLERLNGNRKRPRGRPPGRVRPESELARRNASG